MLNRVRLDKAKRRLEQTDETLEAIALECGFNDRVTFYRQFKQREGISPGAYRKQVSGGEKVVSLEP